MKLSKPPVNEVVIGVQLNASLIQSNHIHEYFQLIKNEYPKIEDHSPLPNVIEHNTGNQDIHVHSSVVSRRFFVNESEDKLLQLQADRIIYNWKKSDSGSEYPHFNAVFRDFQRHYEELDRRHVIHDSINQREVTYVDVIDLLSFEVDGFNPSNVFKYLKIDQALNGLNFAKSHFLPELGANLIVVITSGIRPNKSKILRVETTCRGFNKDIGNVEWFSEAHKAISREFELSLTDKAIELWK